MIYKKDYPYVPEWFIEHIFDQMTLEGCSMDEIAQELIEQNNILKYRIMESLGEVEVVNVV